MIKRISGNLHPAGNEAGSGGHLPLVNVVSMTDIYRKSGDFTRNVLKPLDLTSQKPVTKRPKHDCMSGPNRRALAQRHVRVRDNSNT
jgi:hypothetical protein